MKEIARPVVYYDFEPGVLIRAIGRAHEAGGAPVGLVIDELNRGDCAAIFGDFMHLLDRAPNGRSEYGLDVSLPLGACLVSAGVLEVVQPLSCASADPSPIEGPAWPIRPDAFSLPPWIARES